MDTAAAPSPAPHVARLITLGSGWLWPAAFGAMFVVLFFLPGHSASSTGADALIVTVALLYVAGLSLVGTRLARGVILRTGGSREPIVLLGSGPDPLTSAAIRPRWRLAAVVTGGIVPLAAALVAARLAIGADPLSNVHAIASLALAANAVLAAGMLVPAPGFVGWALLLGVIDATGARPDQRIRRAARFARSAGVSILLAAGIGAALLGDPMLMSVGLVLGFVTWSGGQAASAQDSTARFLAAHLVGDLARPITSFASPSETIGDLAARLRTDHVVVAVQSGGGFLGAIGPRQLMRGYVTKRNEVVTGTMLPLGSLRLTGPAAPAVDVLPEMSRHGFAIVADPDGLAYVEASDLEKQIRIWDALGDRRATKLPQGPVERS